MEATETPKLEIVVAEQAKENDLPDSAGQQLIVSFRDSFDSAYALISQAKKVTVEDATQLDEMARSRELRLLLAKVRTGADKLRRELKEGGLKRNNAIQGIFNVLKFLIEPEEQRLFEQEKFAERRQQERRDALRKDREAALAPMGVDTSAYNLDVMEADDWEQLLDNLTARHEAKIKAEQQAEAERLLKIEEARLEQERIRAENERLRLENERIEREKREEYDKAVKEREALEEKARLEREEAQRMAEKARVEAKAVHDRLEANRRESERLARLKLEEERQKAAAEKLAIEKKAAAEKAEADRLAAIERSKALAAEKAAREAQAKAEAELKAARDAEAAKLAAEVEAKRKAELAPIRVKLLQWAADIREISTPDKTPEFSAENLIIDKAVNELLATAKYIEDAAEEL